MTSLLVSYGLAVLGVVGLQSALAHIPLTLGGIALVLALHGCALYLAPYGEKP